jgi:hypothetical protein
MTRFRISLILVFLLSVAIVNAQQTSMTLGYVKMAFLRPTSLFNYSNIGQTKFNYFIISKQNAEIKFAPSSISSTYYTEHLGMMCKEELKLEKVIKFPVKIRLGSKDQVDYLEGKNNRH